MANSGSGHIEGELFGTLDCGLRRGPELLHTIDKGSEVDLVELDGRQQCAQPNYGQRRVKQKQLTHQHGSELRVRRVGGEEATKRPEPREVPSQLPQVASQNAAAY